MCTPTASQLLCSKLDFHWKLHEGPRRSALQNPFSRGDFSLVIHRGWQGDVQYFMVPSLLFSFHSGLEWQPAISTATEGWNNTFQSISLFKTVAIFSERSRRSYQKKKPTETSSGFS